MSTDQDVRDLRRRICDLESRVVSVERDLIATAAEFVAFQKERDAMRVVVEAAELWRTAEDDADEGNFDDVFGKVDALIVAVDATARRRSDLPAPPLPRRLEPVRRILGDRTAL